MGLIILFWLHYGYLHINVPVWLWVLGGAEWGMAFVKSFLNDD
jgi:hypothetical protein